MATHATRNDVSVWLKAILIGLVLINAFCAGLHTVADNDMGWQMATGRWVVQHHQIPRTDVLTFTSPGQPWMYPPFAGVVFYLVHSVFGFAGLSWFCALACLAAVGYLVRRGQVAAAVLAMLATQSIAARTAPRADLFSTLLFVFVFGELWAYQRGQRARLWLLPILMCLWVNLHPGFIAGLAAIGAYLLLEALDIPFRSRRDAVVARVRKAWLWLAASVAATLLNPWGWGIYRSALSLSGLGPQTSKLNSNAYIAEFRGVPISTHLLTQLVDVRHIENGFTWLLLIAVVLIFVAIWRRQPATALVAAVALYGTIAHARYMGLFVIVIATVGGTLLSDLFATPSAENAERSYTRIQFPPAVAAVLLAAVCALTGLHIADYMSSRTYIVSASDWRFGAGLSSWLPARAAEFIRTQHLPGNVFEEYALGGYEEWALGPEYPGFIDGRGDRLVPELVVEQRALYNVPPDSAQWQSMAERWNLNVVLISTAGFRALEKLSPAAFCASQTWRPVYMDEASLVFLRDTPQNAPWIQRLQINCRTQPLMPPAGGSRSRLYDFYLDSGAIFVALGRTSEAEAALTRAAELYSADPNARTLLARLYEQEERLPQAEQQLLAAAALGGNTLYPLGRLYAAEGRIAEAVQTLQRAAARAVDPLSIYLDIAQLELSANHPQQALDAYAQAERSSPFRGGGESLAPGLYSKIAEGRSEAQRLLGRWGEAIGYQKEATRLTPNDPVCWSRLARLYQATGQQALAAEADQRATQLQNRSQTQ